MEKKRTSQRRRFINFLSEKGRTVKEISQEFGWSKERIEQELAINPRGYRLFEHRNHLRETLFIYSPRLEKLIVKPRIWQWWKSPTGKPYLWISFPDNDTLNFRKIKIVPIADVHFGETGHNETLFNEYIDWIAQEDNVFAFLNGDVLGNTLPDSPGGSIFDMTIRPRDQGPLFREKIRPIAHKILWGGPGGHEGRTIKRADIDPLKLSVCDPLGIPYFDEPVFVDILWNSYAFTFYCKHGKRTSSKTKGGKLNAAIEPLKFQEFVMYVIMAHVHDATTNKVDRICRERKFKNGKLTSFNLVSKKQYVIICPSFFKYFGTYGSRQEFAPGSWGNVTCEIYPNGDYHATK